MNDFDLEDAMLLGTGYALAGHLGDVHADRLEAALAALERPYEAPPTFTFVRSSDQDVPQEAINALDYSTEVMPPEWESYIGQGPLKRQMKVAITAAKARKKRLRHILLASGMPGVGKTHMARLIAATMGVKIIEMVPPFNVYALVDAILQLEDGDILFIDEIHKLADNGGKGAEMLLTIMIDHVAFLDGKAIVLPDVTIIGATTEADKLPEPIIDRFKIKPYFQAYSWDELICITVQFAQRNQVADHISNTLAVGISEACRGIPRIAEEMVDAAGDLALALGTVVDVPTLLEFLEVEPDGLTRTHIAYLTALRQFYGRETKDGTIEFIIGEAAIMSLLRETKQGISRIERFLTERGLIDKTPRGRRLTALGVERAEEFIQAGKGVSAAA